MGCDTVGCDGEVRASGGGDGEEARVAVAAAWRHERQRCLFLTECCLISSVSLADEIMSDKFIGPEIPMNLMAPHV